MFDSYIIFFSVISYLWFFFNVCLTARMCLMFSTLIAFSPKLSSMLIPVNEIPLEGVVWWILSLSKDVFTMCVRAFFFCDCHSLHLQPRIKVGCQNIYEQFLSMNLAILYNGENRRDEYLSEIRERCGSDVPNIFFYMIFFFQIEITNRYHLKLVVSKDPDIYRGSPLGC